MQCIIKQLLWSQVKGVLLLFWPYSPVWTATDCSCYEAEIYINNYFLPSAHLSLQRARGSADLLSVCLGQEMEHCFSQQCYDVVPSTGCFERLGYVVRKAPPGLRGKMMEEFQRPLSLESESIGSVLPAVTLLLPLRAILYKLSTLGTQVVSVLAVTCSSIVYHSVPFSEAWSSECKLRSHLCHWLLYDLFEVLSLSESQFPNMWKGVELVLSSQYCYGALCVKH